MSDDTLAGPKAQLRFMALVLGAATVLGFLVLLVLDSWLFLLGVAAAWAVLLLYLLLFTRVVNPLGEAFGRILMPSGNSTPSAKGYSQIESLVARGEFAKAAEAYQAEIAADATGVGACERLGMLAMRELKDYALALVAYREAERRVAEPKRKLGYGLIVAGLYRDQLKDPAKAVVELRRLLERYPDAPNIARLRSELDEIKASLFGGGAT